MKKSNYVDVLISTIQSINEQLSVLVGIISGDDEQEDEEELILDNGDTTETPSRLAWSENETALLEGFIRNGIKAARIATFFPNRSFHAIENKYAKMKKTL